MKAITETKAWKLGLGFALAVVVAVFLNTVPLRADTCCTQCNCVNLCCSNDGCGGGGVECNAGGCTTYCGGTQFEYWCLHYCRHD